MGPGQQRGRRRRFCWVKTLEAEEGKQVKNLQLRQQGGCHLEVCLLRCGSVGRNGEPERRMDGSCMRERKLSE